MNAPIPSDDDRAALRHLMGAYFHQDFGVEFDGRWESNVDDFIRRSPDLVADAADQADSLVDQHDTDEDLATALDDYGNCRDPGDDPGACASWLRQVAARLRAPLDREADDFVRDLVALAPELEPLRDRHRAGRRDVVLPYMLMYSVAPWLAALATHDRSRASDVLLWLDERFASAGPAVRGVIRAGLVTTLPPMPQGRPVLELLPPMLREQAEAAGLFVAHG